MFQDRLRTQTHIACCIRTAHGTQEPPDSQFPMPFSLCPFLADQRPTNQPTEPSFASGSLGRCFPCSVNMCRLSGCHLCPRCWAWFARIYTSRVCGPCLPPQLRPSFGCHPALLPKRSGRNHRTNRMQPTPVGALGLSLKSLVVSRFRSGVADPGRSAFRVGRMLSFVFCLFCVFVPLLFGQ